MGKNKNLKNNQPDFNVKLSPILGMKPGQYLALLYLSILLIVFLFIFIIPGIKNYGSKVTINTTPPGASVYADGKWLGTTPLVNFVPKGNIKFEFRKDNFQTHIINKEVKGRIFSSLFFPRKLNLNENLMLSDINKLTDEAYTDFAEWSISVKPSLRYQKPPILSDTVKSILYRKNNSTIDELARVNSFLYDSIKNITSSPMMRDFLYASSLNSSSGFILSPSSVIDLINSFSYKIHNNPAAVFWLMDNCGNSLEKNMKSQQWMKTNISTYQNQIDHFKNSYSLKTDTFFLSETEFIGLSNGKYISGNPIFEEDKLLPEINYVKPFYIEKTEVTNFQFYHFVMENTKWAPSNISNLITEGLVTDKYLALWENGIYKADEKNFPVSNISRYAAESYCLWKTKKLNVKFPNWQIRLPNESEWEMAALINIKPDYEKNYFNTIVSVDKHDNGIAGLKGLNGSLWEWTSNNYSVYSNYFIKNLTEHNITGTAVVKGGSWANKPGEVKIFTRGSQPINWCTPYLGFRTVLVKYNN